jgi:pimeloyl-ACP methyl ester carboxylesterase
MNSKLKQSDRKCSGEQDALGLLAGIAMLVVLLVDAPATAAESLPPLKNGRVPATLDELWGNYDPRAEPLEAEIVKEWAADNAVFRYVRYTIGTFKGKKSRMLAYYAFPRGKKELPAILHIHGGGQSASFDEVKYAVDNGYAGMSINWGGNTRLENWMEGDPNTDWGALDCTHPPQRNKANHFAGPLTPDEYTLDAVESPRNSNWFIVILAARRAITFLEQQPEVDPTRIGACGHSMGGKLTTNLAGIENRVKAAVPSCGGSGTILESQTELPGCEKKNVSPLELACVSDNAYIPRITCPILWLSPTNDFHAHIDNMAWNWRNLPDDQVRFSIAPHLNHRHTDEHAITQLLWFEQCLKGVFKMPQTPRLAVELKTPDGIPAVTVTPDGSLPVQRVDVYYSIDPHELTRFWRDARTVKDGNQWQALCPVMSLEQPLFVYANVIYDTPEHYRAKMWKRRGSDAFALSSRVWSAAPARLQAAGVKATDKTDRVIDDGSRGWRDWYRLNWDHPPLWLAATRKLKDPKWRGPDGARLVFEIQSQTDNTLVLKFGCNAWGAFAPGKLAVDYTVVKHLKASPDWQTIAVSLDELTATDLKTNAPLANWQTVCEFTISPSGEIVQAGQKQKVDGKPWRGPREIRNLRWEGGRPVDGDIPEASPLSARSAYGGAAGSVTISQSSSNTASSSSPRCPPKNDPGATSPLTLGAKSP